MTENNFSDTEKMMMYDAQKRSAGVAYLLWFFLGGFGLHRFYLGHVGAFVLWLALLFFGALSIYVGGGILLLALFIWWVVDAFLIPGIVENYNKDVMLKIKESF